jgi:hypothetical protein
MVKSESRTVESGRISGRRKQHLRLKSNGPISNCCLTFMDKTLHGMILRNFLRVNGSKRKLCFSSEELRVTERNCYYRSLIIGSTFGSIIYIVYLIFAIIPGQKDSSFSAVTQPDKARLCLPMFVMVAFLTILIRVLSLLYLNSYIVFLQQTMILTLAALGSYQARCANVSSPIINKTGVILPYGMEVSRPPLTSGGHLPLFMMALLEKAVNTTNADFRAQLYAHKCDQPMVRASAVNTLAEIFNIVYSTIMMWNT